MKRMKSQSTKAISGILSGVILFSVLFTSGATYFAMANQSQIDYQNAVTARQQKDRESQAQTFEVSTTLLANDFLALTVENKGSRTVKIVSLFVIDNSSVVTVLTDPDGLFSARSGLVAPITPYNTTVQYLPSKSYIIRVLTERGNMGVGTYPDEIQLSIGGAALVLKLISTPSPLDENDTVTLSAVVFNFSSINATDVIPVLDSSYVTGTAYLDACSGGCPAEGMQDIPAGENRTFTYSYVVHTGGTGGTASFLGYVEGDIAGNLIKSGSTISAPVQIGGFEGDLTNIGPMGLDWFHFKYTSDINQVLTDVTSLDVDEDEVAFYVKVKNTHNDTLKVLKYSYLQMVRTGFEQSFFIVTNVTLSDTPDTLTAYIMDENSASNDPDWISLDPGEEIQIAFAASEDGGNQWIWGPTSPVCDSVCPEVDSILIVMVYLINGEIRAQSLPFQAVVIFP